MTSLRSQLIVGILVFAAIVGFGTYYLRSTADMVKQMPPESISFMRRAVANFNANRTKTLKKASLYVNDQKQKVIQFLHQEKSKQPAKKTQQ